MLHNLDDGPLFKTTGTKLQKLIDAWYFKLVFKYAQNVSKNT